MSTATPTSASIPLSARLVDDRAGKHDVEKRVVVEIVAMGDRAKGGDHILAHRVFTDSTALREAARESGGEKARLGKLTYLMLAIEQRVVAPRERVGFLVAAQVLDDPRYLGVFIREVAHGDVEERFSADIEH